MTTRNKPLLIFLLCLSGAVAWTLAPAVSFADDAPDSHTEAAHAHDDDHGHDDDHDDDHHHKEHPPEVPDALLILSGYVDYHSPLQFWLHGPGRVILNCAVITVFLMWLAKRLAGGLHRVPTRGQSLIELYVSTVDNFVCEILGREMGRKYLPFLGTLGIYIWFMNLAALVPGFMSPTTYLQQTLALSLCVFVYVQYTAIRYNGIGGFIYHLLGSPQGVVMWLMSPLLFILHVLGELIKPVSLALRLRGNILGEHILLGVFAALGVMVLQSMLAPLGVENVYFGIPIHGLLLPIALIGATIQAMVFMTLSAIYILLVLPHDDHHDEHAPAGAH